jgi:hypothetical protein
MQIASNSARLFDDMGAHRKENRSNQAIFPKTACDLSAKLWVKSLIRNLQLSNALLLCFPGQIGKPAATQAALRMMQLRL